MSELLAATIPIMLFAVAITLVPLIVGIYLDWHARFEAPSAPGGRLEAAPRAFEHPKAA